MNASNCYSYAPTSRRSGHAHAAHAADRSGPGCIAHRPCAHAFLVSPTTGRRLVRAKTTIRDAGIQFEIPQERELPQRLEAVLEAIYPAIGIGWDDMPGVDQRGRDLAEQVIWLARVLMELMPGETEVRSLLALMLHCHARRRAGGGRTDATFLSRSRTLRQWSPPLIGEAEGHLAEGSRHGRCGRFQLEATTQSVHAERAQRPNQVGCDRAVLRTARPHVPDARTRAG